VSDVARDVKDNKEDRWTQELPVDMGALDVCLQRQDWSDCWQSDHQL